MIIVIFLITYLIAAIPTGYWLGLAYGINLTQEGSKSTGATNVLRLIGKWQAILVLTIDLLKGFVPIYYTKYCLNLDGLSFLLLSAIPLIGHSKSIFIKFKGGKSSATGLGILLAINPLVALITVSIWGITVFTSGFSSLGSIIAIPLVPIWLYLFGENIYNIAFGILAFIYIVLIKHRSNILRLIQGKEHNFKKN